jgi:hypothetical protein
MFARLAAMCQDAGVDVNGIFQGVGQQRLAVAGEVSMLGPVAHASCDGYWGVAAAAYWIAHAGLASFAGRWGRCGSSDATWADVYDPLFSGPF